MTLYSTFKAMKGTAAYRPISLRTVGSFILPVYDQIDNLIKTTRPRRSKSIGKTAAEKLTISSHHSETSLNSGSGHSRNRGSIGDGKTIPGSSTDQPGSRTSVDNPPSIHKRAESAASAYSESLNNSSVELEVCFLELIAQKVMLI